MKTRKVTQKLIELMPNQKKPEGAFFLKDKDGKEYMHELFESSTTANAILIEDEKQGMKIVLESSDNSMDDLFQTAFNIQHHFFTKRNKERSYIG